MQVETVTTFSFNIMAVPIVAMPPAGGSGAVLMVYPDGTSFSFVQWCLPIGYCSAIIWQDARVFSPLHLLP